MKLINLKESLAMLFDVRHQKVPAMCKLTVRVENPWAEGKTPSAVEACLGEGVTIDQIIRPARCEVVPRSRNSVIHQGDVLLMYVTEAAQQRTEAFIGKVL